MREQGIHGIDFPFQQKLMLGPHDGSCSILKGCGCCLESNTADAGKGTVPVSKQKSMQQCLQTHGLWVKVVTNASHRLESHDGIAIPALVVRSKDIV